MRAVLCIVLLPFVPLAQVSNFVGSNANTVCSATTFVVAPTITNGILATDLDQEDLTNAANSLASAVAGKFKGSEIVHAGDLAAIDECPSKVVVVRLKSYHIEPARMGQHRGYITVQLLYFDSPKSTAPTETKEFEASGKVHWGDSTPFANAVMAVANTMRKKL